MDNTKSNIDNDNDKASDKRLIKTDVGVASEIIDDDKKIWRKTNCSFLKNINCC